MTNYNFPSYLKRKERDFDEMEYLPQVPKEGKWELVLKGVLTLLALGVFLAALSLLSV